MAAVTPGKRGNQFNLAAQARRQAGSTFKTFVLAAAIAEGIDPDSTYYTSRPFVYQRPIRPPSRGRSRPTAISTSAPSRSHRPTLSSDNTVFAQLTLDLGADKVAAMAHRLGVRSNLKTSDGIHVPSLGLGVCRRSPRSTWPPRTRRSQPGASTPSRWRFARSILPNGKEDNDAGWGKPVRQRASQTGSPTKVTEILEDNIAQGTGTGANIFFDRPAAGKTGTTDDHTDAWFCGYTANLSTTVWVGYPQAQIPMENVHGIPVAGGTFPATIWNLYVRASIGTRSRSTSRSRARSPSGARSTASTQTAGIRTTTARTLAVLRQRRLVRPTCALLFGLPRS